MKTILLKLSGHLFLKENGSFNATRATNLIEQMKQLSNQGYRFGIVIGGGNFFRGAQDGKHLNMQRSSADNVGMLATIMNAIIFHDLCQQQQAPASILSAVAISGMITMISQEAITSCLQEKKYIIFAGGTGCPYFSTDTNAVIRGLQISAHEVWKATDVDCVYDDNPATNPQARPLPTLTFQEVLDKKLRIMDQTAFSLARDHSLPIRVFNVAKKDALLSAAHDTSFGSTITL